MALAFVAPHAARGEVPVRGDAGFALYSDDQATTIWSPHGRVGATVGRSVSLETDYSADVITSASVDVVTAATSRMTELRQQVGASARWEPPGVWALDGGYAYSFERDSASHIAQLGLGRSLLRKTVDLSLRYGLSRNAMGRLGEPREDWRALWVHNAEAGVTVVLGARTEADLVYAPFVAQGYLANLYRRVPVFLGDDLRGAIWLDERVPDHRIRHAVVGRLRRAVGSRWVLGGEYRFYTDDWGLRGHTVEATAAAELPRDLTLRARERFSVQGAADFYRERYTEETGFRTRDRRLGPMLASLGGAALVWEARRLHVLDHLAARLGADFLAFRHDEFLAPVADDPSRMEPLGWTVGYVIQVGVEAAR
ncbi:MAG: DUF3570 domain-containing protein [Myxococcota bacterium]